MRLSDFDYNLPKNLIAQEPIRPRDHSRLLVMKLGGAKPLRLKNSSGLAAIKHKRFYDLPEYLEKGDVLVLNNSKVFPARLIGRKKDSGGKIEVFLHKKIRGSKWQCLVGGRGAKEGLEIIFCRGNARTSGRQAAILECRIIKNNQDGTWDLKFNKSGNELMQAVFTLGQTPLPPYIKRDQGCGESKGAADTADYQTVYADDKKIGSVAAPTAGFHFTPGLIKKLKAKGVQFESITLHVGLGTFAPVKTEDITKHKMHAEYVEVSRKTIARLYLAKYQGRRIIAVGTTSVRTLEAIVSEFPISNPPAGRTGFQFSDDEKTSILNYQKQFKDFKQNVNIFIYPGYKFRIIDGMITNFHLPKSTLLMLVSAFAGKKKIDKAYQDAIKNNYRFYSYGDAMLIIQAP